MDSPPLVISRYAGLVSDEKAFFKSCIIPLPTTGWIHPERDLPVIEKATFHPHTKAEPSWNAGLFRAENTLNPSFVAGFLSGSLLIQEESAMTAAGLLGLTSGQSVLDMCAAPGNKTAQLSLAVGESGVVVANDISMSRLGVVHTTMDRLGLSNVITTVHDARKFPIPSKGFDAVLADVPCTCEGTSRKYPNIIHKTNEAERTRLVRIQKEILLRAIRCVKPGGRIVYSTCTYAPEENEEVIEWALSHAEVGWEVELEPIHIPGLCVSPGITSWNGHLFDSSISLCGRIWPHENDTGGFFLALLRRKGPATDMDETPLKSLQENEVVADDPIELGEWPWLTHTFNAERLSPFRLRSFSSNKYNRLVGMGSISIDGLNIVSAGITGLNLKSNYPKLSTALAQKIGRYATSDVAEIEAKHILPFFNRESVPALTIRRFGTDSNTIIVRSGGLSLGLASWNEGSGLLKSRFPKVWGGLHVAERISNAGENRL